MDNPVSWDYLTTTPGPNEVFGPFAIGFLALFGTTFLVSLVLYSGGGKRLIPDPILRRLARKWSSIALTVTGVGLFFFLIRLLQINPFNFQMRIWLWLSLLAFGLMAAYFAFDYIQNYSTMKEQYETRRRQQQYLRPAASAAAKQGAPLVSGARPVKRRRR